MNARAQSPLRMLAPVALVLVALALAYVVVSSRDGGSAGVARAQPDGPGTYRVRGGDTLARVAERTGVSVERLKALNPGLDPQVIVAGQRIKLRR